MRLGTALESKNGGGTIGVTAEVISQRGCVIGLLLAMTGKEQRPSFLTRAGKPEGMEESGHGT
jgi:hypothetical protein